MAESEDPDRLLTSNISKPRTGSSKKLLELARQDRSASSLSKDDKSDRTSLKSIPENGTPKSGIAAALPGKSEESITVLSNYTKFDNDISDKLARLQTVGEQAVYNRLYRLSWGFHRRTCRVGLGALAKAVGVSRSAAQRHVELLIEKRHIKDLDDWNQEGRLYQVILPQELEIESKTTIGPPSEPEIGIPNLGIPGKSIGTRRKPRRSAGGHGLLLQ